MGQRQFEELAALSIKLDVSRSEVVRIALREMVEYQSKRGPKPQAPSRLAKASREQKYEALLKMSDEEMTAVLGGIGALEIEWVNGNATGRTVVSRDENGVQCLKYETNGKYSGYDVPAFNALLNNVKANLKKYYPNG